MLESFGNYTLLDRLGEGGMGEVYLAKPKGLQRLVALKRIHGRVARTGKAMARFADEANIAARMGHANIAQIYEFGDVNGRCYIAMELIQGLGLSRIFRTHGKWGRTVPASVACYALIELCEALDYAHNRRNFCGQPMDFVHRDVGPRNVMLSFEGEVKLIDFGIAKAVGRLVQTEGLEIKGTPSYMAPEQLSGGPVDRRSDVFASGVVLFELLTGQRLFAAKSLKEQLYKVKHAQIPRPRDVCPGIPKALDAVVCQALARAPDKRYQSAAQLRDALVEAARDSALQTTRGQIASWMQTRYSREYLEQTKRLAERWSRLRAEADGSMASDGIPKTLRTEPLSDALTAPMAKPNARRPPTTVELPVTATARLQAPTAATIMQLPDTLEVPSVLFGAGGTGTG